MELPDPGLEPRVEAAHGCIEMVDQHLLGTAGTRLAPPVRQARPAPLVSRHSTSRATACQKSLAWDAFCRPISIRLGIRGRRQWRRAVPDPGPEPGQDRMIVRRARGVAVVRVERHPAGANRLLAQVGEAQQHGHDPAGREGALQRGGPLRGAFAGRRPREVRRPGEESPLGSELELPERHVGEVLGIRLTCPFFFGRPEDDRFDSGNGQRRGHEEQALGPVELVREMPLPRAAFADRRHVARQPGEVELDDDRLQVPRFARARLDRFPGRLADEQGDPAREAFRGCPGSTCRRTRPAASADPPRACTSGSGGW